MRLTYAELLGFLDRLVSVIQHAPSLRLRNDLAVVTSHPRLQPLDLPLVNLDHDTVTTNTDFQLMEARSLSDKLLASISQRRECRAARRKLLARCTGTRKDVVVVGCPVRLEEDVVTGKTQHIVAIATLSEVEGHGTLGGGPVTVRGSDGESESGSKGPRTSTVVLRLETERRSAGPTDRL